MKTRLSSGDVVALVRVKVGTGAYVAVPAYLKKRVQAQGAKLAMLRREVEELEAALGAKGEERDTLWDRTVEDAAKEFAGGRHVRSASIDIAFQTLLNDAAWQAGNASPDNRRAARAAGARATMGPRHENQHSSSTISAAERDARDVPSA